MLRILAPICPFMADKIYRDIYGKSVHLEELPKPQKWDKKMNKLTGKIIEFNSKIWKEKKEKNMPLNSEYSAAIPKTIVLFEKDLKTMHKLK
jgi:valyl-tRNA synthetase